MSAKAAPDHSKKFPLIGYLFLIGTALFTAISYAFGRAVDRNLDPESTIFFWFGGALIFSFITVAILPEQREEARNIGRYWKIFLYTSVLTSVGAALWIISIRTIGIPLTSFLMKAQTLFALMLGMAFLGERLNRGETVGILITITGGIIVAYQSDITLLMGTLTALGAAFFYSLISFVVKKVGQRLNMLMVANMRALGVTLFLLIYLFVTGTFEAPTRPIEYIYMILGGTSGALIAKACQFQAIKLIDVSRTTAVLPLESLFVILFSYYIFGEIPSLIKLIGGGGIIIGVIFLVVFRGKKPEVLDK
jgi:drug/metabolite transporter (DMT)-like permease